MNKTVKSKKASKTPRRGSKSRKGKWDIPRTNIVAFPNRIDREAIFDRLVIVGDGLTDRLTDIVNLRMDEGVFWDIRSHLAEIGRLARVLESSTITA